MIQTWFFVIFNEDDEDDDEKLAIFLFVVFVLKMYSIVFSTLFFVKSLLSDGDIYSSHF